MRLGVRVGQGYKKILDEKMRDLVCENIQVDEMCGFIGAKQKTVHENNLDPNKGNIWTWIALDSDTKIVPTFAIGSSVFSKRCLNFDFIIFSFLL